MSLCECGCGGEAKPGRRFILGHNRRGQKNSPEHNAAVSVALTGVPKPPRTPEHCDALSKASTGVPLSPEHIASIRESDANKAQIETMRGGNDIVTHHYIYDESDLSKYTVKMTRSDHTSLHNILKGLGYKVPHINR